MEYQTGDHLVEAAEACCILRKTLTPFDLDTGRPGFSPCDGQGLGIGIQSDDARIRRCLLEQDRQGTGAAPDIEDCVAPAQAKCV